MMSFVSTLYPYRLCHCSWDNEVWCSRFCPKNNNKMPSYWVTAIGWNLLQLKEAGQMLKHSCYPWAGGSSVYYFLAAWHILVTHNKPPLWRIIWWGNKHVKDSNQMVTPNYMKNYYNHPCCNTRLLAKWLIPLKSFRRPTVLNKNLSSVCNHKN